MASRLLLFLPFLAWACATRPAATGPVAEEVLQARLARDLGIPGKPRPVRIREVLLPAGLAARHRPGTPCVVEIARGMDAAAREALLRHELTHHVLEGSGWPFWLEEGAAEVLGAGPALDGEAPLLLLRAGVVLGAWGGGLRARDAAGGTRLLPVRSWLPGPAAVLRLTAEDDSTAILARVGTDPPDFHATALLLASLLRRKAGPAGWPAHAAAVAAGADPWPDWLARTGLADEEAVLEALGRELDRLLAAPGAAAAVIGSGRRGPLAVAAAATRGGEPGASLAEAWPGGPWVIVAPVPLPPPAAAAASRSRPAAGTW